MTNEASRHFISTNAFSIGKENGAIRSIDENSITYDRRRSMLLPSQVERSSLRICHHSMFATIHMYALYRGKSMLHSCITSQRMHYPYIVQDAAELIKGSRTSKNKWVISVKDCQGKANMYHTAHLITVPPNVCSSYAHSWHSLLYPPTSQEQQTWYWFFYIILSIFFSSLPLDTRRCRITCLWVKNSSLKYPADNRKLTSILFKPIN